jgi:PRTRC genetic system protein B
MNELTHNLITDYKPKVLITVYYGSSDDFYLESHLVKEDGSIAAGRPLQQETIQKMVDTFLIKDTKERQITGLMPGNLLYYKNLPGGRYKMIWHRPMEQRVLHHASELKIPTGKAMVPPLLYVVSEKKLSLFALSSNDRPNEVTKLYEAPFFNIYDSGGVCLGNAKVKQPLNNYASIMRYWEDLFWLSNFTHINGKEKLKVDMKQYWTNAIKLKRKNAFSLGNLITIKNKNLKTIINERK